MSWVTVIWSMVASACLTLAAIHIMVWFKRRTARADLAFSLMAVATAALAGFELWILRCRAIEQIGTAIRWYHVPLWAMLVSLVFFMRLHLRAGRDWMAWAVVALRTAGLVLNFLVRPNISFHAITGVRQLAFLGEPVSVVEGVPNPLMLIPQAGALLLIVFVADAAASVWRRGDRRSALAVGGSALFFVAAALVNSALTAWQIAPLPLMNSIFYVGFIAAMGYETTREALRAADLANDLRESEARYRSILERSSEGIYRASTEGRILFANPATAKILGYDSPEELVSSVTDLGSQVWAVPEERSRLIRMVEEGGTVRGHECRFRRKDGTLVWVSLSTRPFHGPDGRIIYFDGILENIDERKRADEGRRQSEERFRALAESSLVGIYILQDGKYVYVNPAMARVFGYSVAEMTGMTPREIVQPSDHGMVGENIRRRITGEVQAIQYEVRGRHKDGSTRDVEVYGTRVEINGGPALVGTLVDITARKQAEEALKKSRRLLAETEMIGKVGGWEFETDTMKLTWTPEVYAILEVDPGYVPTLEQAIQFYAPGSRPVIERLVRRAVEHGQPYDVELELITAKGHLRTVHSIGKADLEHRRIYGFFQDVTARKQTEAALAEGETRYRSLFESAPAGIIFIGTDGRVRAANSLQARLYGYESPRQLEGMAAPQFVAEKDRDRAARNMSDQLQGKELADRTYVAVRRDGSEFIADVSSVAILGQNGEVQGYLCLTRDITKQKQDESERIQLRNDLAHLARVMAMSELSTSLAHEINQPLGAILNNAEAVRMLLSQPQNRREVIPEIIDDIIHDAQRAGDVIRRVRGVVKKGGAHFEPLPINALIEEVLTLMHNSLTLNDVALRRDLGSSVADIRGDRIRLQQVLMNLMMNAVDAMKEARTRTLIVRSKMDAPDTVTVSVSDSGKGIPEAARARLFQPYYTTKKDGLGLGLTICRSIIEEHGGRIWVEGHPSGGTIFSFSLKAWRKEPA